MNPYKEQLAQAFRNDVELLNTTRIAAMSSERPVDAITNINFIGGVLQNSPKSFPTGREVWSLFAVPEYSKSLAGTEYSQLSTLRVETTQDIFEAYLENALSQNKGLITYFPAEVSRVKTTFRNWSHSTMSNSLVRAIDATYNVQESLVTAWDLYTVLVQIYGEDGIRMRTRDLLKVRGRGIGATERKLDYGIFIPDTLHRTGDSFKALKSMNTALIARYYPHLNLPEHSAEFDIRAGRSGMSIGEYMIDQQKILVEMLRSRKN